MTADSEPTGAIDAVAVLREPLRRRLFEFVRAARRPVTRDEAAAAVGVSRKLAAFHLDKLTDAGLLRSGSASGAFPAVGRRPKGYEPVDVAIQGSIPARRHELLAEIPVPGTLRGGNREATQE